MRQGTKIEFSGGEVTLHPLNLLQLQQLENDITEMRSITTGSIFVKDAHTRMVRVLLAGAKKAHPDMTAEDLLGMIDMADLTEGKVTAAINVLMGRSGLVRKEEVADEGTERPPMIGARSTPDSPPASDGATATLTN